MKRLCAFLALPVLGCGPNLADYTGQYDVTPTESFSACDNEQPSGTDMSNVSAVVVQEGPDDDLRIEVGRCELTASYSEDAAGGLALQVPEQTCNVSIDEPAILLTLAGEGVILDGVLELTLTGAYETSTFGIPVTCQYGLALTPG